MTDGRNRLSSSSPFQLGMTMLTPGVTLMAMGCGLRVGHPFEGQQAAVAADSHQRVTLFNYCVGGGVENHLAAGALDCDHDYIGFRADAGVFQGDSNERRLRAAFNLFYFELQPLSHRR